MYSVVLAAMLTAGGTTAPAWGCGCSGYAHGCHGYYAHAYYGCCGGCYGCCGGCYGCYGCWGSYYPAYYVPAVWGGYGCYGCYGCYGYAAPVVYSSGVVIADSGANGVKPQADRGTVVVEKLPANAELYVDGQRYPWSSASKSFLTPPLEANRDYFYTFKSETVRDGKPVVETRRVVVRAGAVANVGFDGDKAEASADKSNGKAKVTVRLPKDARLSVDGNVVDVKGDTRTFETPKLEVGRDFYYTLTAEVERDGRKVSDSKRVIVRAGATVDVDFSLVSGARTASR